MKTKKIIKVLKFITDYCTYQDCYTCAFGSERGLCSISTGGELLPEDWNIKDIEKNLKDVERIKINDKSRV